MKKPVLLFLTALLLLVAAGIAWFLYSSSGARLLVHTISRFVPADITAGNMSGKLAGEFAIQDLTIRVRQTPVTISVRSMKLAWHPARLLEGTIGIEHLHLEGVKIEDNRPKTEEPFTFSWPRLPRLLASLQGWIRDFRAESVHYTRLGERTVPPGNLSGQVSWHHGVLGVADLKVEVPRHLSAKGTADADFLNPRLKVAATVNGGPALAVLSQIALHVDLRGRRSVGNLEGIVSAKGLLASGEGVNLESRVEIMTERIEIHSFMLTYTGAAGDASGRGRLVFGVREPYLEFDSRLNNVGLKDGGGKKPVVNGDLRLTARQAGYEGAFAIHGGLQGPKAAQWQNGRVEGAIKGGRERCLFSIGNGSWLGGRVTGDVDVTWAGPVRITSSLRGRGFNPALIYPEWQGSVNTDVDLWIEKARAGSKGRKGDGDGNLPEGIRRERPDEGAFRGTIKAAFPESTLRGKRLTGELAASYQPDLLRLERLRLQGNGFDIKGSGILNRRMDFDLAISDLAGLVPSASGSIAANGWFRWKNGRLSGEAEGRSSNLVAGEGKVRRAEFSARLPDAEGKRISVTVSAQGAAYGPVTVDGLSLRANGTMDSHLVEGSLHGGETDVQFAAQGGQTGKGWTGNIVRLRGTDRLGPWNLETPVPISISPDRLQGGRVRLTSRKGEALLLEGGLFFNPLRGNLKAQWEDLDLTRLYPLVADRATPRKRQQDSPPVGAPEKRSPRKSFPFTGIATGDLTLDWPNGKGRIIAGQTKVNGRYREGSIDLPLTGRMQVNWRDSGLVADWDIRQATGSMSGRISAAGPPVLGLPERATAHTEWKGIDLALFRPWLPANLALKGQLSGGADGEVLPGGMLNLAGRTAIQQGSAAWGTGKGSLDAVIQEGTSRFEWSGASLRGQLALSLERYGRADATFSLPLPARFPPAFTPDGPLALSLKGRFGEKGLITALIPAAVQETKGVVDLDVTAKGTWRNPVFSGGATVKDAGAYIPAAGIRIERVGGQASFAGEGVKVRLRGESGGGWLEAAADMRMTREGLTYDGSLEGNAFQVLSLPEVRAFVTPRIRFDGDTKLFKARGDVNVPRMRIYGSGGESAVHKSPDIVVIDAPASVKRESPIRLDVQLHIALGDDARIEAQGVDARLTGALDLAMTGTDKITARGRVSMVDGGYKAYGIRLAIERGNINFRGPVDRPSLDILAVRKVRDVTAGVQVSGSSRSPVITLYSTPPMSDSDKLSYIIIGQRLNTSDTSGANAIAGAAGIFEGGATPTMTSEARKRLGLESPPGSSAQDEAARSMVSIGRYLTPAFYVGIGRSLTTNENLVTLRYSLSKSWEVESRVGKDTGMDIFYKIEFD